MPLRVKRFVLQSEVVIRPSFLRSVKSLEQASLLADVVMCILCSMFVINVSQSSQIF
jgi:hypothetical protein